MNALNTAETKFADIAPVLDEAINELGDDFVVTQKGASDIFGGFISEPRRFVCFLFPCCYCRAGSSAPICMCRCWAPPITIPPNLRIRTSWTSHEALIRILDSVAASIFASARHWHE